MEIVVIFSTITGFFSHYLIKRVVLANAVSAVLATLMTWLLAWSQRSVVEIVFIRDISVTVVLAVAVSVIVGLVFNAHRRCPK